MAASPDSAPYTVHEMLTEQTLAANTIRYFGTEHAIFDGQEMSRLKRFVYDPTPDTQQAIVDEANEAAAAAHSDGKLRSLAALAVSRHGSDQPVFTYGDIGALRWWFKELELSGVKVEEA